MHHGYTWCFIMIRYSKELIEHTKQVWSENSYCSISDQDAIEILDNTLALFDLILELEEKYGKAQADI